MIEATQYPYMVWLSGASTSADELEMQSLFSIGFRSASATPCTGLVALTPRFSSFASPQGHLKTDNAI